MAHQDYVSRPRSAKKNNNPYKQNTPEPAKVVPTKVKLIGLTTLIAIAMFAYFLWSIKDNEINAETPIKAVVGKNEQSAELPAPPKEKWQYIEQLKSKEVEEGQYEVKAKGPYKMQCGSFRTQKQAEVMKATIAFSGLSAQISSAKGSNGTWYKVFLGPYAKKRQAEKEKQQLSRNNISTCQIWGWN